MVSGDCFPSFFYASHDGLKLHAQIYGAEATCEVTANPNNFSVVTYPD